MSFLPVNPRLPGPLRRLQGVKYVRTVVTSAAYLASLVRRLPGTDVVHCFSASYWSFILAPLPAMVLGRLFGKRVVLNYRSGEADHHLRRSRIAVSAMQLAHAIVVPSGYLVDVFARFGLRAISVFNFVEIGSLPFRERRALRPIFLSNRNFEAHYNVSCVLRAFAVIQARYPDARLVVAGDGPEGERLRGLAAELRLRGVEFRGSVPPERMGSLYDAADIYLNAPDIDNMPNSVIEAFATGLPVVTTDAGGIPHIVTHERTGLMVARGDHAALAAEALRLLDQPALAASLAAAARDECLARYTWPAVSGEWQRCYQAVMSRAILDECRA